MLPDSLKNAFQLYKRDTNAIATWLANTANNNGHPVHTNNKEPKGRLKGKARKEAKAVKSASEQVGSDNKEQAYLLHLRDFVPLASFIAAVKPQIHVPLFMAVTINRVIEVRRTVSRIMGTKDGHTDELSNASHLHFVGVLEQVRDILSQQTRIDTIDISSLHIDPTDAGTSPTKDKEKKVSGNPFEILNLFETSEQVPDSAEAASHSELIVEYEPEPEDKYDEACLAFISLFQDVLKQREAVQELWHNYSIGNVWLGPAAVGTNEAIDICRRMEEEVAPMIKKETTVCHLMKVVFSVMCQLSDQHPDFNVFDIASILMTNVSRILEQFVMKNRQDHLRIYNGSHGWYDEAMDVATSTPQQRHDQDYRALTEALSDIRVLGIVSDKRSIEDEFTRGVRTLLDTNEVTLWQCFAAQTYLDALYVLQGKLDHAWSEMAGTSAAIKSSLTAALDNPGDIRLVEYWRDTEESLKELKSAASEWDTDLVSRYKTEHGFDATPNQFLRRHPLYCGIWVHEMRTRFHEAGVNFASAFGYVHQTFQLYYALKEEKLLGPSEGWQDLVVLGCMQGADTFFITPPNTTQKYVAPITAQGYLHNLRLKSGLSATERAQGKSKGKGKKGPPPNTERGQLKELGVFSMVFKKRFRKTSRREMTAEYLQKIVESNGYRFVQNDDMEWGLQTLNAGTDSEHGTIDIPATQLIVCIAMALRTEAHKLGFDLFLLHLDCYRVLEEIRKTIDEKTVLRLAPESTKQKNLPAVVTMVFRDAAGEEPQGLLQRAATVISKHLREPSSFASTLGERDLGFRPCRCPQNTGRESAATRNCMTFRCGQGDLSPVQGEALPEDREGNERGVEETGLE